MIVAHLDLDAFFAAVEELETPELRAKPLVVGGDPHGRGVVATANYVGAALRDPLGDVVRRGAAPLPAGRVRPAAASGSTRSTRRRSGTRCARSCRRSSGPAWTRATWTWGRWPPDFGRARAVAEAVQAAVRGATSLTCSLGVSQLQGRLQDRERPAQARRPDGRARRPRGLVPGPVRRAPAAGRRPARGGAAAARPGSRRSATWRRSTTRQLRTLLPGKLGPLLRDRARGIDPRPLELSTETVSISAEETFPRDVAEVERLQEELRRLSELVAERLAAAARPAGPSRRRCATRTSRSARARRRCRSAPTTRSGSGSSPAPASTARSPTGPGALRLVGVGVSGLETHRQLELV